jgi:hypothetical protein
VPLPVPSDMMRVRLRATLWESSIQQEEAQFGFYCQRVHTVGQTTDWPADVQELAEKIRDAWNDHITNKTMWSGDVHMDSVKVDHLNAADGKTLNQGVALFTGTDAWVGTGSKSLPWETALVVSLFGYERGVFAADKGRKRGRFYLPPMSSTALNDVGGEVDSTAMNNLGTNMVAFLNDVQGMEFSSGDGPSGSDYANLVVMSIGTPDKQLPPTTYPVTNVYIDSKFDSQRRRERQQPARQTVTGTIAHS